jgi:GT2 family glycosyltransferase
MMDVSIIIVNYNTKQLTNACIDSVGKHTSNLNYEIILVDNASSDGSQEVFRNRYDILFIESDVNLGFGRANNLGAEKAKGNFLFFLNSDTLLIENSIKILHDFYIINQKQLNIGVLGCQLLDREMAVSNSGGIFPTPLNDVYLYFKIIVEKIFKFNTIKKADHFLLPYCKIDMVSGADMFIKKNIFDGINGFDKDFFLYYEETDLQKRISNLGFHNFLIPTTRIIHLEGSSFGTNKTSNFKRIITQESRNRYFRKHHSITFYFYILVDSIINCTRLFNIKYSFSDNKQFVLKNIKSYFN